MVFGPQSKLKVIYINSNAGWYIGKTDKSVCYWKLQIEIVFWPFWFILWVEESGFQQRSSSEGRAKSEAADFTWKERFCCWPETQWKWQYKKSVWGASKKVCRIVVNALLYSNLFLHFYFSKFLNYRNPASAQHISSSDRLTIYFHAVLSKDFKFNLEEDRIFIRAGGCLGDWENNLVDMSVSRLVKFFWSNYRLFITETIYLRIIWFQGSRWAWISCRREICMQEDQCRSCVHTIQVCCI